MGKLISYYWPSRSLRNRNLLKLWNFPVSDFLFVLCIIYVRKYEPFVQFRLQTAWKCTYEIPVPDLAWIIHQPKLSANMFYLCGAADEFKVINSLILRIISETDPAKRYKTLIERGALDEAEVSGCLHFKNYTHFILDFDLRYRNLPLSSI